MSKHYEVERWVDHVRGLGGAQDRALLEAHLASGCEGCGRQAEMWRRLAATAGAEAGFEPPRDALQRALAIFVRPASENASNAIQILARLVYDSFRDPLPAGLRSTDRPSQARFEADDYCVDLHLSRERMDREIGAKRMVLVGQISHIGWPDQSLADLPVLLVAGREVMACGRSNQQGEFHLEYDPAASLRLRIPIEAGKRIEIPLPRSNRWEMPT